MSFCSEGFGVAKLGTPHKASVPFAVCCFRFAASCPDPSASPYSGLVQVLSRLVLSPQLKVLGGLRI